MVDILVWTGLQDGLTMGGIDAVGSVVLLGVVQAVDAEDCTDAGQLWGRIAAGGLLMLSCM